MLSYTVARLAMVAVVVLTVATLTFLLMHGIEGGPFDGEKPLPASTRAALEARYGLDEPIGEQYLTHLAELAQLDFGVSFASGRPVREIIAERFAVSVQLGLAAFMFAIAVGVPAGAVAAVRHRGAVDVAAVTAVTLGAALPAFVLAPFLQITFALRLDWFDVLGWELWNYKKMVLPTLALGVLPAAFIARVTRAALLDTLHQDYIRTARAKGGRELRIVLRHALPNALVPLLTISGPIFAGLVTGSFVVERAFQIPGLGRAFVDAIFARDYGVVMGVTIFAAALIALANLVVDLLYAWVDPRIRLAG